MSNHLFLADGTVIPIAPPRSTVATRRRNARQRVNDALRQLPNPDPILRKAGKNIQAYRDLLVDGHISSCVQSRKAGVLSLEWEISQGNTPQDVFDFVVGVFDKLDLDKILTEMLEAPLFGYSFHEIEWSTQGGRFVVTDVVGKPQEWFKFNEENHPLFVTDASKGEQLPDYKFLVVQHQSSFTNPYGQAILSKCFWPATFKNQLISFGLQFAEKYGQPFLFGKYDPFESAENIDSLHNALLDLAQAGIATIPNTTEASLLEAGRSSSVDTFMRFIVFFNAEISKAILSQTLTTEQGDTGSYAMSQTHLMVRKDVVDADRRLCEGAINQLIEWLVAFNFRDAEAPRFRMYEEQDVDAALADRDAKLYALGVRFNKHYVSSAFNIPEDHFDIVDPNAPASPAGAPAPSPSPADAFKGVTVPTLTRAFEVVPGALQVTGARDLSANISSQAKPDPQQANDAMAAMLAPVIEMAMHGRSYEDLSTKLVEIFGEMDDSALADHIANAIFLADVAGRLSV